MSSEILDLSKEFFAAACLYLRGQIRGLDKEGEPLLSQDKMARMIDCSLSAYRQWEGSKRIPSGDMLIRMVRLRPEPDILAKFGLDISRLGEQNQPLQQGDSLMRRAVASDKKVEVQPRQKRKVASVERLRPGFRISKDDADL